MALDDSSFHAARARPITPLFSLGYTSAPMERPRTCGDGVTLVLHGPREIEVHTYLRVPLLLAGLAERTYSEYQ